MSENRLLTDDILYGVGSVSKVYTAAAMMRLVEDGKVDLDAPVTTYLPDFTMADARYKDITVRMLLNHSSGLMGSAGPSSFLFGDGAHDASDDLLERLSTQTLQADPGAYSVYSNDSYTLAQLVIEAASGMDYGAYLHEAVIEPLGLENTFVPADNAAADRFARTYLSAGGRQGPAHGDRGRPGHRRRLRLRLRPGRLRRRPVRRGAADGGLPGGHGRRRVFAGHVA